MTANHSPDYRHTELQRALEACGGAFALAFAFSCGFNLLTLASPIYLLQLYDRVLSSRSADTLLMLTLIVVVTLAVGSALDALRRAALSRIGAWLDDRLRPAVLAAAFQHALCNDPQKAAEAWRDLATLRSYIASSTNVVLFDAPWTLVFIGTLFLVAPVLGWCGVGAGTLLFSIALVNELLTRGPLTRANELQAKTHHRLAAALRNAEAIRAMGMLEGAARLVQRDEAEAREAHDAASHRAELAHGLSKTVRPLVQIMIMGTAAWLVILNDMSPGIIFAASLLLARGLAPIEGAIAGWKSFGSARHSYWRLTEVLADAPSDAKRTPLPHPEGALTIENLSFLPPGSERYTLWRVSLSLQPGEVLGVLGVSGAGKSTLGRLIVGARAPSDGRICLDGADIAVWLDRGGARHIGYLPQDIELFDGSVRDNIARLDDADPDEVIEAAKLVGLHDTIMRLPDAYDTEIGEGGVRLSGGQRQRLGLARAFFGAPRLVVLDEPNASLDHEGERALYEAIERLKDAGTTIVIITHRLSILNTTDKLVILQRGTVGAFGRSAEILETYVSAPPQRQLEPDGADEPDHAGGPDGAGDPPAADAAPPAASSEDPPPARVEAGAGAAEPAEAGARP